MERWAHVYTDGSAAEVTRNGGGCIFIKLNDGGTIHHAVPTRKYSTTYKAEAEALRAAASILMNNMEAIHTKEVLFSHALSVIQTLPTKTSMTLLLLSMQCNNPLKRQSFKHSRTLVSKTAALSILDLSK